jgi:hypothetical protein
MNASPDPFGRQLDIPEVLKYKDIPIAKLGSVKLLL